ncbi:hypothetical protein [Candidatus Thiodictyon syntrophicum]|jgi:hypothetical protein|uniref:Uncharacterized protein n=1 Tax=Candidatus Thiodictyon syntrophicum TaxID=1166950 RepID=A0A2K8UCF0_9GAMM|nr:hypothetical protein [Candidatus Thiodictyon syntrophicum]AUB83270.1 hypothetical protein THSYN_21535 [Candidatus Thiodictyon syntrophicum]
MTDQPVASIQFVVCIDNRDYPASLELHKIYPVVPDEDALADGDFRVIDESGEDYLYAADRFVAISIPLEVQKSIDRSIPRRAGRG